MFGSAAVRFALSIKSLILHIRPYFLPSVPIVLPFLKRFLEIEETGLHPNNIQPNIPEHLTSAYLELCPGPPLSFFVGFGVVLGRGLSFRSDDGE